jgi:ribosome-associated protein
MRSIDTEPLQAALDEVKGVSAAATARQHHLEKLRERVMADDAVFAEIGRDYPGADIQYLRQLRRNALKEIEQQKPPRAYRELFRQLRELVQGAEKVGAGETAPTDTNVAD